MNRDVLRALYKLALVPVELLLLVPMVALALVSRLAPRPIDVGLGPEPLINNVYHKLALAAHGHAAETFVTGANFITAEYDVDYSRWRSNPLAWVLLPYYLFALIVFRYKALFIYFNGGPLRITPVFGPLEPFMYKLAGVKVVVMPYGSDVQVMSRSENAHFKHVMSQDYPDLCRGHRRVARNVDRWTRHADWVISGCEWVDYTYFWHTLMLAHFSIDLARWSAPAAAPAPVEGRPFTIFHAPNHTAVKGTEALRAAVEALRAEGLDVELVMLRGVPNHVIRQAIAEADLVADQFVIGWYAMFAIEAMAMGKPVLCYLRPDLVDLYEKAGLVAPGEIPLLSTDTVRIAETIRWAMANREALAERARRGPGFVAKHHSTEHVGRVFAGIMAKLGIPAGSAATAPAPLAGPIGG